MSNYIKEGINSVRTFMYACDQTVNDKPTVPSSDDIYLRVQLTLEELTEFIFAAFDGQISKSTELNDALQHLAFAANRIQEAKDNGIALDSPDMLGMLDALTDIEYVNLGAFATFGFDGEEAFRRVHESNMSKVMPSGKVIKNENGKVLKPDTFIPVDLTGLV